MSRMLSSPEPTDSNPPRRHASQIQPHAVSRPPSPPRTARDHREDHGYPRGHSRRGQSGGPRRSVPHAQTAPWGQPQRPGAPAYFRRDRQRPSWAISCLLRTRLVAGRLALSQSASTTTCCYVWASDTISHKGYCFHTVADRSGPAMSCSQVENRQLFRPRRFQHRVIPADDVSAFTANAECR
jgi:hypothetical protein